MNPIRLLVLLAATLFAGPFHLGASWEWRIFDPNGKEVGYRVARVVDSTVRQDLHQIEWAIEVFDTALDLEPTTRTVRESFDSVSGGLIAREWACAWENEGFCDNQDIIHPLFYAPVGPFSLEGIALHLERVSYSSGYMQARVSEMQGSGYLNYHLGHFEGSSSYILPPLDWDESAGWSHFRWLNTDYQLSNSEILDWILVKKDGMKVAVPAQTFHLPRNGDIWMWERNEVRYSKVWKSMSSSQEEKFESSDIVRIVIDSAVQDSSGIVQIHAKKTIISPISNPAEAVFVRWRPDSMPNSRDLNCDDLMGGFRFDWMDQKSGDSVFRYYEDYLSNMTFDSGRRTRFVYLRSAGGVDSLHCAKVGTKFGAYGPSETYTTVTYRFLSVRNPSIPDPEGTGGRSRIGLAKVPFDLREFAKAHPDALVKIVGADGRQRTRMARELFGLGSGSSLRVGWFEVRLPDGSVQRGSFTR